MMRLFPQPQDPEAPKPDLAAFEEAKQMHDYIESAFDRAE